MSGIRVVNSVTELYNYGIPVKAPMDSTSSKVKRANAPDSGYPNAPSETVILEDDLEGERVGDITIPPLKRVRFAVEPMPIYEMEGLILQVATKPSFYVPVFAQHWDVDELLTNQDLYDTIACTRPGVSRPSKLEADRIGNCYTSPLKGRFGGLEAIVCVVVEDVKNRVFFLWRMPLLRAVDGPLSSLIASFFIKECRLHASVIGIVMDNRKTSVDALETIRQSSLTEVPDAEGKAESPDKSIKSAYLQTGCFYYKLGEMLICLLRCKSTSQGDGEFSDVTSLYQELLLLLAHQELSPTLSLKRALHGVDLPELEESDPPYAVVCFEELLSQWKKLQRLISDIRVDYMDGLSSDVKASVSECGKLLEDQKLMSRTTLAVEVLKPIAELAYTVDQMVLMEAVNKAGIVVDGLMGKLRNSSHCPESTVGLIPEMKERMFGEHEICGFFLPKKWQDDVTWQTEQILKTDAILKKYETQLGISAEASSMELIDYFRKNGEDDLGFISLIYSLQAYINKLLTGSVTAASYWELFRGNSTLADYLYKAATIKPCMLQGDRMLADIWKKWSSGYTDHNALHDAFKAQWALRERRLATRKVVSLSAASYGSPVLGSEYRGWSYYLSSMTSDNLAGKPTTPFTDELPNHATSSVVTTIAESVDENIGQNHFPVHTDALLASSEPPEDCESSPVGHLARGVTHRFFEMFKEVECSHICLGKWYKGCLMANSRKKSGNTEYHILYDKEESPEAAQLSESMSISTLKLLVRKEKLIIPVLASYVAEMCDNDGD
ncbi:hypothetical protein FOL47_011266 [Perkinsus chesapeaki]|uniref:Uncharacterized protein n=1 Tax=Perkinsus chesapeaki TaxID=330153 RepID=A0A7J6KYW8_PERCH|nr:hypothetical protein FOL47_011266 [Perkinsus chesapeaki]